MSIDTAEVTHEQSRFITATLPEVWALHADAAAWPRWNGDVLAVTRDGPMAARSTVTATTSDGGWRMRVYALTDQELTLWGDVVADGSRWLQAWTFDETPPGVHVAVATSVLGSDAPAGAALAARLRAAADRRLDRLQVRAEARAA